MKKFGVRRSMIALALTLCIGVAFWLLSSGEQHWTVKIATATPGGIDYPLGIQLAHILKELPPIRDASIWETSGSVQNIRLLGNPRHEYKNAAERERAKEGDSADLAFVQSTALAMASSDQREKLRALAGLYRDFIQVVVRGDSKIKGLADLRGKRVYIGKDGSGNEADRRSRPERGRHQGGRLHPSGGNRQLYGCVPEAPDWGSGRRHIHRGNTNRGCEGSGGGRWVPSRKRERQSGRKNKWSSGILCVNESPLREGMKAPAVLHGLGDVD